MNVTNFLRDIRQETSRRVYFTRIDILHQTSSLIKVRLYIKSSLFVQVYYNGPLNTTNFVLIYNRRRVYARDQLDGVWHRHPAANPRQHDTSPEGCRSVTLSEFLDEVESVLAMMGLP